MYPHAYVGNPVLYSTTLIPWNVDVAGLNAIIAAQMATSTAFGGLAMSRKAYTPTGQNRWSGGYLWTIAFTTRNGMLPPMATTSYLNIFGDKSVVHLEVGTQQNKFSLDDPGTAVLGNQVAGYYGLSITDQLGKVYTSTPRYFPVVSPVTGQALSAREMQTLMNSLFDSSATVQVNRSATVNEAMGYTYSVTFVGMNGNMPQITVNTAALTATAATYSANVMKDVVIWPTNPSTPVTTPSNTPVTPSSSASAHHSSSSHKSSHHNSGHHHKNLRVDIKVTEH
jgi:hypothetical protein